MSTSASKKATSKVQTLCTQLRTLAYQQGPNEKLPTVRELCHMFGVSRVSLYEALDELESQNVLYREQSKGIFVSPKLRRKTICVLLDATLLVRAGTSPFWGMLWGNCAAITDQRKKEKDEYYTFYLISRDSDDAVRLPEEIESQLAAERIHGIIAIGLPAFFNPLVRKHNIPCVTFAEGGEWLVAQDVTELIKRGVKNLVEQGCKTIGLWDVEAWLEDGVPENIHEQFFRSFLSSYGASYYPEHVHTTPHASLATPEAHSFQERGFKLALEVFGPDNKHRPDGLLIMNDMMTDGVLAAFQTLGIQVGRDVRIATHANVGLMMLLRHIQGMTVIEYDSRDIALALFTMLDTLMNGETPAQHVVEITPKR